MMPSQNAVRWILPVTGCVIVATVQRTVVAMATGGPSPAYSIITGILVAALLLVLGVRQESRTVVAVTTLGTGLVWALLSVLVSSLVYVIGWLSSFQVGLMLAVHAFGVGTLFGVARWLIGDRRFARMLVGGSVGFAAGAVAVGAMVLVQLALGAMLVGDSLGALAVLEVAFLLPATVLGLITSAWIRFVGRMPAIVGDA